MKTINNKNIICNLVAVISIIILCFAISPKTLQNDTYYSLKIGEHIINNGINMMDPFSWHEGLKYTFPHWLYDVMMYGIFSLGSWDGIYYSTCIFASILGIVLYFTNEKISKNKTTSFLFTMIVMYLLKDFIAARAQIVTFILFAITIFLIERFVQKPNKKCVVGLVLISLLIANLHCAVWPFFFILFLPYIGEYLFIKFYDADILLRIINYMKLLKIKVNRKMSDVQKKDLIEEEKNHIKEKLEKITIRREKERRKSYKVIIEKNKNIKFLIIIALICTLMGLITPIKDTPYTYLIKTMEGNTTQNINEHSPIVFWENQPMLIVYSLILLLMIFTKTKFKLRDLFLLAGLMILAIMSKRQTTMLLIVGMLPFNKYVSEFIRSIKIENYFYEFEKVLNSLVGGALVVATVLLVGINLHKDIKDDKYISESSYPVYACEFILENLDLNSVRFFNEYNYGSYMLYKGIPVFIDSRADLYAPEFNEGHDIFSDFLNISNFGTDFEEKFDEYKITHVILSQDANLNKVLKEKDNYLEIYSDKNFVIYERKTNQSKERD